METGVCGTEVLINEAITPLVRARGLEHAIALRFFLALIDELFGFATAFVVFVFAR